MKKIFAVSALVMTIGLTLVGCTNASTNGGGTDGVLAPTTKGDDVTISQLSQAETDKLVDASGSNFSDFTPVAKGNKVTFITVGSKTCKETPIAAKAESDATKIAFKVYDQKTTCSNDFGTYGWTITFKNTTPFAGAPFLRCEGDKCYSDTTNDTKAW
jgi:uncharacterized lipoprotein NlpE involved in copper resistance